MVHWEVLPLLFCLFIEITGLNTYFTRYTEVDYSDNPKISFCIYVQGVWLQNSLIYQRKTKNRTFEFDCLAQL